MIQSKNKIIKEVVRIILNYVKPARIYLYGSQANGEASSKSGIDIAYNAEGFKKNYLIIEDINKLETLVKINIKNLAETENRFRNRVITTGKVLYSATKNLRAEDGLYNFKNAFNKFSQIVDNEDLYNQEGFVDVYLDVLIKRFEFTYEMAWKALKRYLSFTGIEANNPRMVFKEAFAQGIIDNELVWLDMIEQRNLSSHIYDESEIKEILDKKDQFSEAFSKLEKKLTENLKESL